MDSCAVNRYPKALEISYRLQRHIVQKICADEEFNNFDLEESL